MNVSSLPSIPAAGTGATVNARSGNGESQPWTALAALLTALSSSEGSPVADGAHPPSSAKDSASDVRALLHRNAFSLVLPEKAADAGGTSDATSPSSPPLPVTCPAVPAAAVSPVSAPAAVQPPSSEVVLSAAAPTKSNADLLIIAVPLRPTATPEMPAGRNGFTASLTESAATESSAEPLVIAAPLQPAATPEDPVNGTESTALPAITAAALVAVPAPVIVADATAGTAAPATIAAAATALAVPDAELETGIRSQESPAFPVVEAASSSELAFAVRLRETDAAGTWARPVAATSFGMSRLPVSPARSAPALTSGLVAGSDVQPHTESASSFSSWAFSKSSGQAFAESADTYAGPAAGNPVSAAAPEIASHASASVSPAPAPVPFAASRTVAPEAPATPLRAAQAIPLPPVAEDAAAQPVHEISIRISDGTSRSADIHISDRAGEVKISVRSADTDLSANLRDGLSGLSSRLERHAVNSEIWQSSAASSRSSDNQPQGQSDSRNGSQSGQNGQSNSDTGGGQTPRRQHQTAPEWLEEMENSLGTSNKGYPRS